MSPKPAALVAYVLLAGLLLQFSTTAHAATIINTASLDISIVSGKLFCYLYHRSNILNLNLTAGTLICDSQQCPATSNKCSVWRKNSVNDINTLTTYRKCFDLNGKTIISFVVCHTKLRLHTSLQIS